MGTNLGVTDCDCIRYLNGTQCLQQYVAQRGHKRQGAPFLTVPILARCCSAIISCDRKCRHRRSDNERAVMAVFVMAVQCVLVLNCNAPQKMVEERHKKVLLQLNPSALIHGFES